MVEVYRQTLTQQILNILILPTPITSSHRGRSVSSNSNSTDSQCFDSTPITLNPCSRNVWVNSDPIDSNYFDMISNSERD